MAAANLDFLTWRWTDAEKAFKRGAELSSQGDLLMRGRYAYLLSYLGRFDEAIDLGQRFVALNPADFLSHFYLGFCHGYAKRYDDAIATFGRAAELAPAIPLLHQWSGFMHIAVGDRDAAFEELRVSERLMAGNRMLIILPELAYGYGRLGSVDDAQRIVDEIVEAAGGRDIGAGSRAAAHLAVGDESAALESLEAIVQKAKAHDVDQGFYNAMALKMNATADPLLDEPRFRHVLDRIHGD